MSYPDPQYIDVAAYTADYDALVAEAIASDLILEGVDYHFDPDFDNEFRLLHGFTKIQRNGPEAFCILRVAVDEAGKLLSLQNLDRWKTVPVLAQRGEMSAPGGVYDLPSNRQAVLDAWPDFNYLYHAGSH